MSIDRRLRAWGEQTRQEAAADVDRFGADMVAGVATTGRDGGTRRPAGRRWALVVTVTVIAAGVVTALVVLFGGVGDGGTGPRPLTAPDGSRHAPGHGTGSATHSSSSEPTLVGPSPPEPRWGNQCGNIRNVADARSIVVSRRSVLLDARLSGTGVLSYAVLAGKPYTEIRTINLSVPAGRYIVLLARGPGTSGYFVSLGYYGLYRVEGTHAYQLCAYGAPEVRRTGVTSAAGIIELFRAALR